MRCTAFSVSQVACTESEYVSPTQIGALSTLGGELYHLALLNCHWYSKCFIKTREYLLREDHACTSEPHAYCCKIQKMKKANIATIWLSADKCCSYETAIHTSEITILLEQYKKVL